MRRFVCVVAAVAALVVAVTFVVADRYALAYVAVAAAWLANQLRLVDTVQLFVRGSPSGTSFVSAWLAVGVLLGAIAWPITIPINVVVYLIGRAAERKHHPHAWQIVCPDGALRCLPYINKGDADCDAGIYTTQRRCCTDPVGEHPPCPKGRHVVARASVRSLGPVVAVRPRDP